MSIAFSIKVASSALTLRPWLLWSLSLISTTPATISRHDLHSAVSAAHPSSSHSTGKHLRDPTAAVNMVEEFIAKLCASCGKQFKPKAAQHKMCDACFGRRDKKASRLSPADTSVTMTPAAKESFNQRRKFKSVKKKCQALVQAGRLPVEEGRLLLLFWPSFQEGQDWRRPHDHSFQRRVLY